MRKRLVVAAMAVAVLSACEKQTFTTPTQESETVVLEVNLPSPVTKAVNVSGEDAISSYQVFVYSLDNGLLEAYSTMSGTSTSVKMNCRVGNKEVVVLANAPDLSNVVSLSALKQTKSLLEHNSVGALVMEGNDVVELTASSSVEIKLRRLVAKIRLTGVTVNFESTAYNGKSFELVSAYLINVAADKPYLANVKEDSNAPSLWYNKLGYVSNASYNSILRDNITSGTTKNYSTEHVFYAYPNPFKADDFSATWSSRPTRLIVEAKLDGQLYYYPIALCELAQNTAYDVSLTITRPGTTDINADMTKYEDTFTIKVLPWETGEEVKEIL